MIQQFAQTLPDLAIQFEAFLTPHLTSIQEIGEEAQKYHEDDPGALDMLSSRKSAHLARISALIAPLEAFRDHAMALATQEMPVKMPPLTVKALAKGKTAQYQQAYTVVERLSTTLTHQMKSLDGRVWKSYAEIKAGLLK